MLDICIDQSWLSWVGKKLMLNLAKIVHKEEEVRMQEEVAEASWAVKASNWMHCWNTTLWKNLNVKSSMILHQKLHQLETRNVKRTSWRVLWVKSRARWVCNILLDSKFYWPLLCVTSASISRLTLPVLSSRGKPSPRNVLAIARAAIGGGGTSLKGWHRFSMGFGSWNLFWSL